MKKTKLLLMSLLMVTSLFSCNKKTNKDPVGDDPGDLVVAWSDGRAYIDESKLSGEVLDTTKVRIHYTRTSPTSYDDWDVWSWQTLPTSLNGAAYSFAYYDAYGVICDIPVTGDSQQIGFIIRRGGDSWLEKDIDKDRFINIPETTSDGIYDIYVGQGKEMFFESREDMGKEMILKSYLTKNTTDEGNFIATVELSCEAANVSKTKIKLFEGDVEITDCTFEEIKARKMINIIFPEGFTFDFNKNYKVKYEFSNDNIGESELVLYNYYNTEAFNEMYNYDGDDLGVTFNNLKTTTTFKLWAPISSDVKLNIYESGTYSSTNKPTKTINMVKGEKGVWSVQVDEYLHGKYYTYSVTNKNLATEVVDPYAKSCGLNGQIGMIVDFDVINEELKWDEVKRPTLEYYNSNVDASIYEIHVRDMTIDSTSGVSEANRGKFLGLAEEGTTYTSKGKTVKTGLDHIKELGVSHVQIQPFYDFASIDESNSDGYNWGYDPLNYNCLEGSYSSDPTDGLVRIKEFKTMMKAMLENNIQVNMDVVYNHTSGSDNTNFEKIVPGYYHRLDNAFGYSNGSGCGNEMASENYMYRKFIVDSCKFWMSEYKLSGYRFDLMGLVDVDTMSEVYKECSKIYDKAMVYGEPWTGGTSTLSSSKQTNQNTIERIDGVVAAFNDKIRNSIKGDNNPSLGWVQNGESISSSANSIRNGLKGTFFNNSKIDPNCVINYVSCHDNYTLFDQLDKTLGKDRVLNDVYKQCEALIFTGQGITFIQEGEDFLRTKSAGVGDQVHNSYNAGDKVNKMDYSLKVTNNDMFNYVKDLIKMRIDNPLLRLGSRDKITEQMKFIPSSDGTLIAFKVASESEELYVIHSLNKVDNYDLGGNYTIVLDENGLSSSTSTISSLNLKANSSIVLKKA